MQANCVMVILTHLFFCDMRIDIIQTQHTCKTICISPAASRRLASRDPVPPVVRTSSICGSKSSVAPWAMVASDVSQKPQVTSHAHTRCSSKGELQLDRVPHMIDLLHELRPCLGPFSSAFCQKVSTLTTPSTPAPSCTHTSMINPIPHDDKVATSKHQTIAVRVYTTLEVTTLRLEPGLSDATGKCMIKEGSPEVAFLLAQCQAVHEYSNHPPNE